ncbi:MAG TPA: hypothetical protein VLC46_27990 [Thermoanaerobaculia bacterium]|jgi:hypothetical protein|nr:hypothetical protein [Thermoanaerobaculia bacterium]
MRIIVRMLIVSLLAAATSLRAITYIVPNDRDLVKRAEAIVIAAAVESHSEMRSGDRLVTVATLQVERVLKGSVGGETVQLVELGGAVGKRVSLIPGSPRYEDGKRYLVFLRTNNLGEWMTYGFALGKFEFVSDLQNRELVTRGDSEERIFGLDEADGSLHVEHLRGAPEFLSFVESRVASEAPAREDYFVDQSDVIFASFPEFQPHTTAFVAHAESTRYDYMLDCGGGTPCRWQNGGSASFVYCCSAQTGGTGLDGPSGVSGGMAAWNAAGAGVAYSLTGQDLSATGGLSTPDGKNGILFNDPQNIIPPGAVAVGGISNASGQYTLGDGLTYFSTKEVDVVTGKNVPSFVGQSLYIQLLTHELGHTLGFHHADGTSNPASPPPSCQSPSPCASIGQAIMASVLPSGNSIGSLGPWDMDAVNTVYGAGPVCNAPQVTTQPSSQSITSGNHANLSVAASGTPTLTYQWYIGTSGTTTTPVNGATGTTFTPSPATTTSYWVRVSNSCNGVQFANSNTAVVTVTCAPPTAPAPVPNPSSIAFGQSSSISETPTGTGPFNYQWYIGNSGVTTSPIGGATSSSVMVSPTTTTSYWVRVTGQCTPTADSPATSVTVTPCVPPSAPAPNASPSSIPNGQSSTLSVSPTGSSPFTYQWYIGNPSDTSNPIGGATNSFVTVSPTVTTNYWVRVTGLCAPPSDSPATTVTVTCSPIAPSGVTAQPSNINAGQSSTLFFSTAGSGPFTIQWYTGSQGDTSNPIAGATGTSIIVSPAVTTGYWVHVVAGCGTEDGSTIVFVTGTPCVAPSISTQPASSTINAGSPVTLTVAANGTAPFTYQWYIGNTGDVSHPVAGATSISLTQSPSATTKYWVRVSNSCNGTQSADSNAATITIGCTSPSITTQPANVTVEIGTAATLHVVAAGTGLHYAWFQGAKGDTSKPTGSVDSPNFVSRAISGNTSFWVRVTGTCGSVDSNAAAVTVIAAPRRRSARH